MSPALAARVQASVEGRRAAPGATLAPGWKSLARFTLLAIALGAISWFVVARHRARQRLESERSALIERARRESGSLTSDEKAVTTRVLAWLVRFAGNYEGDLIADELRSKDALRALLTRPSVYVRGPLASFNGIVGLAESASASRGDAFILCLVDPPASKTEKLLRGKARAAYHGIGRIESAARVERLHDAFEGLPFLAPEWEARVRAAEELSEIESLKQRFERAPIAAAKRVAKAPLLLFAMDEPGDKRGPAELDGERPHDVRVGVVDLAAAKLLLRLRRRVDPSFISPAARAEYASGIDSCALALDVHAASAP